MKKKNDSIEDTELLMIADNEKCEKLMTMEVEKYLLWSVMLILTC